MGYKTISLSDEAYKLLKRQKREKESFSEVVKRILAPKTKFSDFAGIWAAIPEEEIDEINRTIRQMRDGERFDESLLG